MGLYYVKDTSNLEQKVALSGKISETLIPTIELKASPTKIRTKLNKWQTPDLTASFATSVDRQIDKQRHLLYIFIS